MSQVSEVLAHLERGHTLTPIEALNKYGIFRLAARIKNLRDEGHPIDSALIRKNGKKFARYWLTR